jgi:hypothetical protein
MMDFITNYWYLFALVILALAMVGANRLLKGKAKTVALQYLVAAEKMVFTTTESKLSVVSIAAYKALPTAVKAIVSPFTFEMLMTSSYDEAKSLIDKLHEDPSIPMEKK